MKPVYIITCFFLLLLAPSLFSCSTFSQKKTSEADSLNILSYQYHYKDLDSCRLYAGQALLRAEGNPTAIAQAYNNLAFCAFMQMDFEQSKKYLDHVYDYCKNELELLVADIGMMKICQRTSRNKQFYDYRNSALRRLKRIEEEASTFSRPERLRLLFARSEFHIVSSIYFFYLQQIPQSLEEIDAVHTSSLPFDQAQWLYYNYMKGSGGLCPGVNAKDIVIKEVDYLTRCVVDGEGYTYFVANCLQAFAETISDPVKFEILKENRSQVLKIINPSNVPDSVLPVRLAQRSLELFKQYGDIYQIAGVYRTLGTCLIRRGRYVEAVDSLQRALDYVSLHHSRYYGCTDSIHHLSAYPLKPDSLSPEMAWMNSKQVQTVPEWIARIREQLSIAYAGMGWKTASDYNRNIYLDILDVTRQDKALESRYDTLEQESSRLTFWLILVVAILVAVCFLLFLLNDRWKRNNAIQVRNLQQALDVCRHLLTAVPLPVSETESVCSSLQTWMQDEFVELFGTHISLSEINDTIKIDTEKPLTKDERTLLQVIRPYIVWAIRSTQHSIDLGGERQELEAECYSYEQRIVENKRQNIVKKACVSIVVGILPYLHRLLNEVRKLIDNDSIEGYADKQVRYTYIRELAEQINDYNEILARWIQMRQGSLNLNIETFALDELFDIVAKGRKAFEAKKQVFTVMKSNCWIKADKALTLFMINTLVENARKYTPEGGHIRLEATETEQYIEIAVIDDGRGLSAEDIDRICNQKVYDSSSIGMIENEEDEELRRSKGSGFGLMNCKGIIDKYRKTNEIFKVCLFAVDSVLGKGSRFYFRLPKSVRKIVGIVLLLFSIASCTTDVSPEPSSNISYYDKFLEKASAYADSVYYANVDRNYHSALVYADSVFYYLNKHYKKTSGHMSPLMTLSGTGDAAEITWWNEMFDTDYHVVLDVRNEVAVASLALKNWDDYHYNNNAYTYLYKLLSQDTSLEHYCREMEFSTSNKIVSIILCFILLLAFPLAYYLLYFRHRMLHRFNLEQLLQVNRALLSAASPTDNKHDTDWQALWKHMLDNAYTDMNEWLPLKSWGVAVYREEHHRLETVFYPSIPQVGQWVELVNTCYENCEQIYSTDKCLGCFPLFTSGSEQSTCIGVLVVYTLRPMQSDESLLLELIARYVSILVMNNVVRMRQTYNDLELKRDDKARARREENILHVQNMVLDNCLSALKHETLYYPNRIRLIAERLLMGIPKNEEREQMQAMEELMSYYCDIFTLLSSCAVRQLQDVTFKRQEVKLADVISSVMKYVRRQNKRNSFVLNLHVEVGDEVVLGDETLIIFLLENLLHEAYGFAQTGDLYLKVQTEDKFIRVNLTDSRRTFSQEELDNLFYPDLKRMIVDTDSKQLCGTEYLICKQIVREHDEFTGHSGCRMNAEMAENGGFTVWFTLKKK